MTTYPNSPGYKEGDTSKDAADRISGRVAILRQQALDYIKANPLKTADQIANALNETPLSIRPRITELRKAGLIRNEGRGVNASGCSAHRWREATPAERQARARNDGDDIEF